MSRTQRLQGPVTSVLATLFLCACMGGGTGTRATDAVVSVTPSDAPTATIGQGETVVVELSLGPHGLTPATIDVEPRTKLRLEIATDRAGVLHVEEYGYAISQLSPGEIAVVELTADRSSPIILHTSTGAAEEVGALVVAGE